MSASTARADGASGARQEAGAAIRGWGGLPALPRLLDALVRRGHRATADQKISDFGATLIAGIWTGDGDLNAGPGIERILVLSCVGAHPDARAPVLRRQWSAEERARALGLPVLTLRLAPLVGPRCPLWRRLRGGTRLPRRGRPLLRPVLEEDVVETLDRALTGQAPWEGCFEVCGRETWSLAELASLARRGGRIQDHAHWEPPIDVLLEQRLPDPEPWLARFGLAPGGLADRADAWR